MGLHARVLAALKRDVRRLGVRIGEAEPDVDPDPLAWTVRALGGLALDTWQQQVITSTAPALAINAARQSGKSTIAAAKAAREAAANRRLQVIVISPSFRQSGMMRDKIASCLRLAAVPFERSRDILRLATGSSVIVLPGDDADKVRGYTADLVLIDECAFVKDAVGAVVLPMIAATGGRLVAISTPAGKQGMFFDFVHAATTEVITVRASEVKHFDPEVIADLRARLGPRAAQELDCEFVASARSVFDPDALAAMFGAPEADAAAMDDAADQEADEIERVDRLNERRDRQPEQYQNRHKGRYVASLNL